MAGDLGYQWFLKQPPITAGSWIPHARTAEWFLWLMISGYHCWGKVSVSLLLATVTKHYGTFFVLLESEKSMIKVMTSQLKVRALLVYRWPPFG